MNIHQLLLPEFEAEMANTRKVLASIPDDKLNWCAHPKSNTMGWVANHLADIVGWTAYLSSSELDLQPVGGEPYQTPKLASTTAILELFDKHVTAARQFLTITPDATYAEPWSLLMQGQVLFTMPKLAVIRTWILNHSIHHRAHLCVYLRLNDLPVPGMYGPSGDEGMV